MSWPCYMVEAIENVHPKRIGSVFRIGDGPPITFDQLKVGACLRNEFRGRVVKLPGPAWWYMDDKGSDGCLWKVTGEPPELTATPSINLVGRYHGWVTNGVVTDDCEGRKFDDFGKKIP